MAEVGRRLVSVVVPAFNESASLPTTAATLVAVLGTLDEDFELIFVNDGSADDTAAIVRGLAAADGRIRLVDLSRNFGKEVALSAGLHEARGDAVVMLDADGQHPPALLPKFVDAWKAGAEVVVGVRDGGTGQTLPKRIASNLYYRVINGIAERKVVPRSTDYRLLDRVVVDEFNRFTERNRITRGLIDWLGFRREFVYFTADIRAQGSASYSFNKLIRLALDSFVSTSLFPLRVAGYLGAFITVVAAVSGVIVGFDQFVFDDPLHGNFTGTGILAIVIVFLVGIILSCLGLIALYIANIHTEGLNRPLYVVRPEPERERPDVLS